MLAKLWNVHLIISIYVSSSLNLFLSYFCMNFLFIESEELSTFLTIYFFELLNKIRHWIDSIVSFQRERWSDRTKTQFHYTLKTVLNLHCITQTQTFLSFFVQNLSRSWPKILPGVRKTILWCVITLDIYLTHHTGLVAILVVCDNSVEIKISDNEFRLFALLNLVDSISASFHWFCNERKICLIISQCDYFAL